MSLVFLIGMPGAGKSHWARVWSAEHGLPGYDLDELIESYSGETIPEIIARDGEPAFREIESRVLEQLVRKAGYMPGIVSCGGGTPTIERNLSLMRRHGCIVYLDAEPAELLRQLQLSGVQRPLLKQPDIDALRALLDRRTACYRKADIILPIRSIRAGTFAEILQACINRHS